ncbi:hypothetical protein DSCO28_32640 [Desulfosarcina ovata subsp. sediminis]|uniref:Uncharacterized protein n=1 Tax=Desulfosarcina ovata subsp. sediminis TaxID=885957 RepID=A0A5K7ZKD6_9BACT|nr:hypothetical protein [Desulfosarcina ovata]BBO82698.1 hypothetical protein DSCO28_32640 [Desulfosarcina ovata subsp. sediminis]
MKTKPAQTTAALAIEQPSADTLSLRLSGSWRIGERIPSIDEVGCQLSAMGSVREVMFDATHLTDWVLRYCTLGIPCLKIHGTASPPS